jgi:Zn ribbon nucleic-acid-binding protein
MSKVSCECPICDGDFVIVMINNNQAWPECWKCGFSGHSPEDKEAMSINTEMNSHLDGVQLFRKAVSLWTEYLTLLKEENKDKPKEYE